MLSYRWLAKSVNGAANIWYFCYTVVNKSIISLYDREIMKYVERMTIFKNYLWIDRIFEKNSGTIQYAS